MSFYSIYFAKVKSSKQAFCLFLSCAINVNINALNQVFTAYIRQVGIFEHLKENPTFLQHDTFRVYGDMCGNKDICGESFYQLNGIYKKIFNKSDKFISMEIQAEAILMSMEAFMSYTECLCRITLDLEAFSQWANYICLIFLHPKNLRKRQKNVMM